ncbi:MAG: LytTR family DNA-binding domain-containing protein [Leisingera sp.]
MRFAFYNSRLGAAGAGGVLRTLFGLEGLTAGQVVKYCAATSAVAAAAVTLFTPLSTAGLSFVPAALLWMIHLFASTQFVLGIAALAVRLQIAMPWPWVLGILGLPFLLAPVSLVVDGWFDGSPLAGHSGRAGASLLAEFGAIALPSMFCAALSVMLALRVAGLSRPQQPAPPVEPVSIPEAELRLRQVLPLVPHSLGNDLVRVEAQDHYVKVVTAQGNVTIKQGFSECVGALEPFLGVQCHRSHWIRFKHVKSVKRAGSAYVCLMEDGSEVPVSRRRYSELKRQL